MDNMESLNFLFHNFCLFIVYLFVLFSECYCAIFSVSLYCAASNKLHFIFRSIRYVRAITVVRTCICERDMERDDDDDDEGKSETRKCSDKQKTFPIEIFHFVKCKFVYSSENLCGVRCQIGPHTYTLSDSQSEHWHVPQFLKMDIEEKRNGPK